MIVELRDTLAVLFETGGTLSRLVGGSETQSMTRLVTLDVLEEGGEFPLRKSLRETADPA